METWASHRDAPTRLVRLMQKPVISQKGRGDLVGRRHFPKGRGDPVGRRHIPKGRGDPVGRP